MFEQYILVLIYEKTSNLTTRKTIEIVGHTDPYFFLIYIIDETSLAHSYSYIAESKFIQRNRFCRATLLWRSKIFNSLNMNDSQDWLCYFASFIFRVIKWFFEGERVHQGSVTPAHYAHALADLLYLTKSEELLTRISYGATLNKNSSRSKSRFVHCVDECTASARHRTT